jgi:hypothetical protein
MAICIGGIFVQNIYKMAIPAVKLFYHTITESEPSRCPYPNLSVPSALG